MRGLLSKIFFVQLLFVGAYASQSYAFENFDGFSIKNTQTKEAPRTEAGSGNPRGESRL